ncbi:unnamed protein product [Schistosoma turkestanicum]|nr:unnamed protein product [Schistosoma turkestanicum]
MCTGKFCGRLTNTSIICTSCTWGSKVFHRINHHQQEYDNSICELCLSSLSLHGWLYLGFLTLLPVIFLLLTLPILSPSSSSTTSTSSLKMIYMKQSKNFSSIHQKSCLLILCNIFIHTFTSLITLILYPPFGSFKLYHCPIETIEEFYAPFLAASGCISEVNFPLTSIPLVYYMLSALMCLFIYPILFIYIFHDFNWFKYLYYALYSYPIICLVCFLFGGLFYYIFPYILLFYAIIDSLYRFPLLFDYVTIHHHHHHHQQHHDGINALICPISNPRILIQHILNYPEPLMLISILMNSLLLGYGILSFSMINDYYHNYYYWCLLLIFFPFIFYMITLPCTHPFQHDDCVQIWNKLCNSNNTFHLNDYSKPKE